MNKIYLIPLTLIVLFSCKTQTETKETLITFENALEYDENTISFESARFVKLENNEDAFIGDDIKMKMVEDKIYLMDDSNQQSILRFDNEGKFINKIGQKGNGPEEYSAIFDFCLKDDTVNLLVRSSDICIYSYLKDGSFLEKLELEQSAWALETNYNGNYLLNTSYSPNDSFRIYTLDKNGEILQKFLKNSTEMTVGLIEIGNSFFKSEESILFRETFNDTIYSVANNYFVPKFVMDFGSFTNSAFDKYELLSNMASMLEVTKRGMSAVQGAYENKDYVLINYHRQREGEKTKMYYLLYDKKSKNISTLVFNEDNAIIFNFLGLTENNELAFIVYPYGKELDELKQLIPDVTIPKLNEKDNAMLVFCKL